MEKIPFIDVFIMVVVMAVLITGMAAHLKNDRARRKESSARAAAILKKIEPDNFPGESKGAFMARMMEKEDKEDRIKSREWRKKNPEAAARLDSLRDGSHWNHSTPKIKSGRFVILAGRVDAHLVGVKGVITDSCWAPGGGTGYVYDVTLDNNVQGRINHADIEEI